MRRKPDERYRGSMFSEPDSLWDATAGRIGRAIHGALSLYQLYQIDNTRQNFYFKAYSDRSILSYYDPSYHLIGTLWDPGNGAKDVSFSVASFCSRPCYMTLAL